MERKLRMLVEVSTYRGEFCGERSGLFEKIHEASGVWVERARSIGRAQSQVNFRDTTLAARYRSDQISDELENVVDARFGTGGFRRAFVNEVDTPQNSRRQDGGQRRQAAQA